MAAIARACTQDHLLSHLQPRDVAALRCRGSCFMEVESTTSVDVAVTAFHLIFLISHQGTHASRLAWGDVATLHLSTSPQGRHCAIIEFLVNDPKPATATPVAAVSSPKLTKVAQLIHADTTAKAADDTVRTLKNIFAERSVHNKIDHASTITKPLMLYIEDTQSNDNEHSIVIASQRAFLYHHFHTQTQHSLLTKSLVFDDVELLKQYSALENDFAAAASVEELLMLLEDLEDGARHHSIKHIFLRQPLILNCLTKKLSSLRQQSSLLSNGVNIRVATAVLRCISSIACDAYSTLNTRDAIASSSAEHCLLAAVEPLATEEQLSDVSIRAAVSGLLRAQVEAVFHCLFLCFCSPIPAPVASFLSSHFTPEQIMSFVASTVYSLLRTASFLFDAKDSSSLDATGRSDSILEATSSPKSPQAESLASTSAPTNFMASLPLTPPSSLKAASLSVNVNVSALGNILPSNRTSTCSDDWTVGQHQSLEVVQKLSVSVVQHLILLHSLLPPASPASQAYSPLSFLQPHEVELRYLLRKESLHRVSRFMSPQLKQMMLDVARNIMLGFPQQSFGTRL